MEIEGGGSGGREEVGRKELTLMSCEIRRVTGRHTYVHVGFRYNYTYTLSLERWHEWMSGNSSMSPS